MSSPDRRTNRQPINMITVLLAMLAASAVDEGFQPEPPNQDPRCMKCQRVLDMRLYRGTSRESALLAAGWSLNGILCGECRNLQPVGEP